MRGHLWTLTFVLLPTAAATAQVFGQFNQNLAQPPTDVPPADRAAEAGQDPQNLPGPPNAMFSAIDADGDGVITARELRRAAVQLKKLDADKDGNITLAEVGPGPPMMGPMAFGDPAQFVERLMQNDANGDGKLAAEEVPPQLQPMLATADQNGDGFIDPAELTTAMQNRRGQFPGGPGPWGGGPPGQRGPGGFNQPFDAAQMTGRLMQNDLDGDGKLSANEVPPQAMGMLRGGDQNNDGAIDAAELGAVMARMGERGRALNADAADGRNGERGRRRGPDNNRERPRNQ